MSSLHHFGGCVLLRGLRLGAIQKTGLRFFEFWRPSGRSFATSYLKLPSEQTVLSSSEPTIPAASAPAPRPRPKTTIASLHQKYLKKEKLVMTTVYDATTAAIADAVGMDYLLVGDSAGNCVLGYDQTTQVTMDEIM